MALAPRRDRVGGRVVFKLTGHAVFARRFVMRHPGAILYCQTRSGAEGAVALPVGGDRAAGMANARKHGSHRFVTLVADAIFEILDAARRLACPLRLRLR